jgi:hypothetical protein
MADEEKKDKKKIIVDEDWKAEAQKEKEILAAKEETEEKEKQQPRRQSLPEGNLAGLISMLVTQALYSLGAIRMQGQEEAEPDLELARYNIDMLETLEEKTKGNLSEAEQNALSTALNEVRMVFVKVSEQQ